MLPGASQTKVVMGREFNLPVFIVLVYWFVHRRHARLVEQRKVPLGEVDESVPAAQPWLCTDRLEDPLGDWSPVAAGPCAANYDANRVRHRGYDPAPLRDYNEDCFPWMRIVVGSRSNFYFSLS